MVNPGCGYWKDEEGVEGAKGVNVIYEIRYRYFLSVFLLFLLLSYVLYNAS